MKKIRIWVTIVCCAVMLLSTAVCFAETTENAEAGTTGFATRLDYVAEKDDTIECSVIIEALEGSFKTDVLPEEITLKVMPISEEELTEDFDPMKAFADVSELTVVSNDGKALEVSFSLSKGEVNADEFAMQSFVVLADGVLLDNEGNTLGEMSELATLEMDVSDRAAVNMDAYGETITLKISHNGAYIAKFYVEWDEIIGEDENGKAILSHREWDQNGMKKTSHFQATVTMQSAVNISVKAQVMTGLMWDPWHTPLNRQGLSYVSKLEMRGTTLRPNITFQ